MEAIVRRLPFPTHIDFEGQHLAERIFQVLIVAFGVVGFAWGYLAQQFSLTVYTLGVGFAISCLIVLPPWPFYRRHSLNWYKPGGSSSAGASKSSGGGGGGGDPSKKKKRN